ncbi:MAG: CapA family protein [Ruminococcaceae bacterium]|nr:CapA family protein [Oscillospiraceae bacterium]
MKFTAAGDALLQQRIPQNYEGFAPVRDYIARGDARFFNLETTLNYEGECYASQFSGGTYVRTNPEGFEDLLEYGFNMTSFNNNHTMDFSYEGMLKTLDVIDACGVVNAGVGRNLDEAAAPRYLDTPNGRVALISINTYFEACMMAGKQSRRFPGRPGINGLRHSETLMVEAEDFAKIQEITEKTGINFEEKIHIAQGYSKPFPEGICQMGNLRFQLGEKAGRVGKCNEEDLERVKKAIFEAQLQANYILISVHHHEMGPGSNELPPDFLEEFAHFCIDVGAHAVIGHGPHLLRPVEVYKNRPIFYSLGDFILQLYSVPVAPEDFYAKQGLTSDETVHALLAKRSANFSRGLMEDPVMTEAVVPYWEMENGELTKLELLPVVCRKQENKSVSGLPVVGEQEKIARRLARLSEPYGVKMTLEDGIIKCSW